MVDPTLCQVWPGVSATDLEVIRRDKGIETVQFSVPLSPSEIGTLERIVFANRPDITLRVFGHYGLNCDLTFLEKMSSVQRLSADCLQRGSGIAALTRLPNLSEITIGIFNLEGFEFLDEIPATITKLGLHATASKAPSIASIGRFSNLRSLYLERQRKGIEAVSRLTKLEEIVLRSISTPDVRFLSALTSLWSVDVKLGGIKNFDALTAVPNLKYLELWEVRGLCDLSFISKLSSLQNLFLQSLKNVTRLPDFTGCHSLRRIHIENMKGLEDLRSLEHAPNLTEFAYVEAANQSVDDLLPVLRSTSVASVLCGFGSDKKNHAFEQMMAAHGKQPYRYSTFIYL